MHFSHNFVSYVDDNKIRYSTVDEFADSNTWVSFSSYQIKRRENIDEREYRFVFMPFDENDRPMKLPSDTLLLDAAVFRDFIGLID